MSIFDKFETKEALLSEIEKSILSEKSEDGKESFFINDESKEEARELKGKFDAEVQNAKNLRKRAQTAESEVNTLKEEVERLKATNAEFSKYNPEKQRDEISRLLTEVGQLKADNKSLKDKIAPLTQTIADYRKSEDDRRIEKEIIDVATKLGIRPEAMNDVLYRKTKLHVSDTGIIETEDGVTVYDFIKSEYDSSPLWHPRSEGGGSNPGTSGKGNDNTVLYQKAKEQGNIAEMIKYAPAVAEKDSHF